MRRAAVAGTRSDPASRYLNRELAWLDFNARVLALAADPSLPLLERVKFCAIFASNLDEFYEVRIAGLHSQHDAGITARSVDGMSPSEQLGAVRSAVRELSVRHAAVFVDELVPLLAEQSMELVSWEDLASTDRAHLAKVFAERIFPVLTPLAVDPAHPFPYISNLSLNLAVLIHDPETGDDRFARVKVPPLLQRFVGLPDGRRWIPLESVIAAHLDELFPGMEIRGVHLFRVTRNADLALEEEDADDLLEAVETELRRRRFGRAVRLEVGPSMPSDVLEVLLDELELESDDVIAVPGPLDLTGLWAVYGIDRPDLKDAPWVPRTQARLQSAEGPVDMFEVLREGDVLVHHPYDSFSTSVERFIQQAATDPSVLTIKLTLYRTSGDSPVVKALIDAAERGKQVAALVELKARFDEQANIAWARKLEQAGVHVVYGLVGLKTHTKVALVVRSEADGLRRYCHVATGNYNSSTARIYEDLGLFSSSPALGDDLTKLFNGLTGYSRAREYAKLLVAPHDLRSRVVDMILGEKPTATRGAGRIFMKMNSLVDPAVIEALYEASQSGVQIDLVVRGICCLRPGVPGLSESIRVRSIIGRFLEHSRILRFHNGHGDGAPAYYIGSADMMPRNLDRRVEAVVPVEDPRLRAQLDDTIDVTLRDNVGAWTLDRDGAWNRVASSARAAQTEPVSAQEVFMRRAVARSQG